MKEVREYFQKNYSHIDFWSVSDSDITEFLSRPYLVGLSFERKMDCLYDYILSQNLCDVEE